MRFHLSQLLLTATLPSVLAGLANADMVVLANRLARPIEVDVVPRGMVPYRIEIAGGAVVPIPCERSADVSFKQNGRPKGYRLGANAAYYLGRLPDGSVDLQKIGLGGDDLTEQGRRMPGKADSVGMIDVIIAVDEEETALPRVWDARLRKRFMLASQILEQHCRTRFKIVGVTTWDSDDAETDFLRSLVEFEKEVDPSPARLAVGFTSQYQVPSGRTHLGGTRGPLRPHILLREWSKPIGEPERLEMLVHELGHHLGAAHSPEPDSIMRPLLGGQKSRRAGFVIRFDPVSALTMNLVAEEVRRRDIRQFSELTHGTKMRLRQVYSELATIMPKDTAAGVFQRYLRQPKRR